MGARVAVTTTPSVPFLILEMRLRPILTPLRSKWRLPHPMTRNLHAAINATDTYSVRQTAENVTTRRRKLTTRAAMPGPMMSLRRKLKRTKRKVVANIMEGMVVVIMPSMVANQDMVTMTLGTAITMSMIRIMAAGMLMTDMVTMRGTEIMEGMVVVIM